MGLHGKKYPTYTFETEWKKRRTEGQGEGLLFQNVDGSKVERPCRLLAITVTSNFASSVVIHVSIVTTTIQTPRTSQAEESAQVNFELVVLTDVEKNA
ncbi:hypothetical protein EVAR_65310_1 [Eumeta japonica]|uniref:Uncharacterized protein n=1 Tax=Eumeta variegata TaxID=151549 RepID=A0A4C1YQS0_EUMVA|nr:hypothetical protein EVAR_65310_1 [Eumeta japonica]